MTADVPEVHLLSGAYALHALDDDQRRAFERHLAACPPCAAEVTELLATVARLGSASTTAPPPRLRSQVLAQVATVAQLPPSTRPAPFAGRDPGQPPRRLPGLRRPVARLAAVAAAVLLVASGLIGRSLLDQPPGPPEPPRTDPAVAAVLTAPDARRGSAAATTGGRLGVVTSATNRAALVTTDGLRRLPADRTYQLWLIGPTGPRSAGLLPGGSPTTRLLAVDLATVRAVALSIEPSGGSLAPTRPVLQLPLR